MIYYQYWKNRRNGKWHFRARGKNHEIIVQGDPTGYHNEADCLHAIQLLKESADAKIEKIENKKVEVNIKNVR